MKQFELRIILDERQLKDLLSGRIRGIGLGAVKGTGFSPITKESEMEFLLTGYVDKMQGNYSIKDLAHAILKKRRRKK